MVLSKSGSRFPQLVDQAVGCGSRPIPMSMALSFMVSHTKHRMIPASFGDGAVRLARKKLRAGHFRQFRPEQRSRSKGSWFPLISRKPQGDHGRNPACNSHRSEERREGKEGV